jgi:hypothetical protein
VVVDTGLGHLLKLWIAKHSPAKQNLIDSQYQRWRVLVRFPVRPSGLLVHGPQMRRSFIHQFLAPLLLMDEVARWLRLHDLLSVSCQRIRGLADWCLSRPLDDVVSMSRAVPKLGRGEAAEDIGGHVTGCDAAMFSVVDLIECCHI